MKKIVGILGMAAVLASGAFAADPATNFVMSEFDGSAEFGWKAELKDTDDVKMGMYNTASASLKFGFITAGDKVTTGNGVWGELKISNAASDAAAIPAATVDTAKIHFVDGDFSMALNILKPSIEYAAWTPVTAAPAAAIETKAAGEIFKGSKEALQKGIDAYKEGVKKAEDAVKEAATVKAYKEALVKLEEAKEMKINWAGTLDKETGSLTISQAEAYIALYPAESAATATTLGTAGLAKDRNKEYTAGFGLNVAMKDIFDLNVNFVDNGFVNKDDATKQNPAKDKYYAVGADVALTAVEGLTAKVAQVTEFNKDTFTYFGLQALAGYEFKIDDKLYVNPAVAFETSVAGEGKDFANVLSAGLMFGWGAKAVGPTMDYFNDDPDDPKTFNEGVSVAVAPSLKKDTTDITLAVSMYDQSLFSLLGIEDYGTLKTAFGFDSRIQKEDASNTVRAAVAYDVTFSPVKVELHAGMKAAMAKKDAEFVPSFKFGAKLSSSEIIANTDVFVGFEGGATAKAEKLDKAEVTVGTKIHF